MATGGPKLLIAACLAAVYLIWGTTYLAIRIALEGMPPLFQMGSRFLVAGGLLFGWLALRRRPWPTRRQWGHSALVGALLMGCAMGGVAVGEQWISSGATTVLIGALPLAAVLWGRAFGERPGPWAWLAVGLGSAGILTLTAGAEFRASPAGTAAILFAITAWSFGSQLSLRLDLPEGAMGFAAEMFTGGLILLLASWLAGESWPASVALRPLLAWGYLVVAGSLVAFSAYMVLVERTSPLVAASYAYANPPIALVLGALVAHEGIAPQTWAALPLILAAVALLGWSATRPKGP
ncbi:MAG: drug/metabolite exporter YedA [Rhodocyclaceae bacterium]|jgi:drug/metabolite transporter (DMT)-like permease|nr:drug/metabolite exporter YedA [Rhodocyclaceae bacterium]